MTPDLSHSAAFLRTALLLGIIREREVIEWAETMLLQQQLHHGALADVAGSAAELTALREALGPLAQAVDSQHIAQAILAFLARDETCRSLPVFSLVRILSDLRREHELPMELDDSIKAFSDRWMLGTAGVGVETAPTAEEIHAWLHRLRTPVLFGFSFSSEDELAAFVAAVARRIDRDRPFGSANEQPHLWRLDRSGYSAVLNAWSWEIVTEAFGPVPMASRIPFCVLPPDATPVLFGYEVGFGIEEARGITAGGRGAI